MTNGTEILTRLRFAREHENDEHPNSMQAWYATDVAQLLRTLIRLRKLALSTIHAPQYWSLEEYEILSDAARLTREIPEGEVL